MRVSKNAKNVQKGFKAIQNCFHFGGELYLLCVFVVNPIWLKTKKKKTLKVIVHSIKLANCLFHHSEMKIAAI